MASWLSRTASIYRMSTTHLVKRELGIAEATDNRFDLGLPPSALARLEHLSGLPIERLAKMTIAGLDFSQARRFSSSREISVLLPRQVATAFLPPPAAHWVFDRLPLRACPICLRSDRSGSYPLLWRFPLLLSCELHQVVLEDYNSNEWRSRHSVPDRLPARLAEPAVVDFDRRTRLALEGKEVDFPRGTLSPSSWLSLVHQLLEELAAPAVMQHMPARTRTKLGLTDNDRGQDLVHFGAFETRSPRMQRRRVLAAARVMFAIGSGRLVAPGANPALAEIRPLQPTGFTPSLFLTYGEMLSATVAEAFTQGSWTEGEGESLHDLVNDHFVWIDRHSYNAHVLLELNEIPWPDRDAYVARMGVTCECHPRTPKTIEPQFCRPWKG